MFQITNLQDRVVFISAYLIKIIKATLIQNQINIGQGTVFPSQTNVVVV